MLRIESDAEQAREAVQPLLSLYTDCLWLGDDAPSGFQAVTTKQALGWLGQDCEALVVDLHDAFSLEALAAVAGTVRGGGVLVFLLPETCPPVWQTPFMQHFFAQLHLPEIMPLRFDVSGTAVLPVLPEPNQQCDDAESAELCFPDGCRSAEQFQAVEAVRRVVTGHRRRPLVLTADRGRGKSSALGIAAASLMLEKPRQIVVTAPRQRQTQTLFQHAARMLDMPYQGETGLNTHGSRLQFMAPDHLLAEAPAVDLLIVDEAAAIPAPLLQRMLVKFSRVVFASTVHGYEGTGRGFAIKFKAVLNKATPQWRAMTLTQPIRWADDDPLEAWLFDTLLLDAEPALLSLPVDSSSVAYQQVDSAWLMSQPAWLKHLFGLLVHAHYQTSPSDLKQLLDDPLVSVFVALSHDQIIGCALVSKEGGFPAHLAEAIAHGQRRPKGHLLAQSVAAHLGIAEAAHQHCARILRIAVHDDVRRSGVGAGLLQCILKWAQHHSLDYLGTSFAASGELLPFWEKAGYTPIRLGVMKDAASGCHSLLMVLPLSTVANRWFHEAQLSFAINFMAQACEQFQQLDVDVFLPLYRQALNDVSLPQIPASTEAQLQRFSHGGLGYDLIVGQLTLWLQHRIKAGQFFSDQGMDVLVAKVLQRRSWADISVQFGFTGRKQAELFLRNFVANSFPFLTD
ncbi:tRNA(Met) cytidine acetyltransferase TmcA [Photobacterium sp. 1_MG-2023]|uniref:tRNA(Met) cytidine acetyltransferase TmcA n=1 Tax=Photobacterium sp. 1_MG-2023 TaxID=3062646 RepID=UPI0026E36096|nr:GNAT family N-acetyltransferase [Photobacterium sp. 1_MG-2023]MDO6708229.1 GNAT family N-acetyltransferase [Photobacterium sp. 1_MG-2023]